MLVVTLIMCCSVGKRLLLARKGFRGSVVKSMYITYKELKTQGNGDDVLVAVPVGFAVVL